ncbi:DUF1097 domain-containing protein [Cupriavidus sp. WKF15]|uniref:DUF1097 domain-containing protein n=1 Tax=Cupriavidus sp. WKF15 TaxID=3032282 RepID=UPI0023E16EE5|nr:DUF1097 domain-containing protein [Cupriavidus sp. WKF15]WER50606.1 DUF1097 domain-containing protein [Cupriavidus sp. WKF15]
MKKLPAEIVASLLAITTVLIALPPYHLPPWAIFISWAATFAMGGPTAENLKKIWPTLPVGSVFAFLIVLCFRQASTQFTGTSFIVAQMVILFSLNGSMMFLARVFPRLSFIPGMFFGFASYFATLFGGFGPVPHDPVAALGAVVAMNALGPAYAWLKERYSAPEGSGKKSWRGWQQEA